MEKPRRSSVSYAMSDNLSAQVTVNGQSVQFVVDTGANLSNISENAAKALRLAIRPGKRAQDVWSRRQPRQLPYQPWQTVWRSGNRYGMLYRFLVVDNDAPLFEKLPINQQGVPGLPVLIAFQRIAWTAAGRFEVGVQSHRDHDGQRNLCFDGVDPVTQIEFQHSKIPGHSRYW